MLRNPAFEATAIVTLALDIDADTRSSRVVRCERMSPTLFIAELPMPPALSVSYVRTFEDQKIANTAANGDIPSWLPEVNETSEHTGGAAHKEGEQDNAAPVAVTRIRRVAGLFTGPVQYTSDRTEEKRRRGTQARPRAFGSP
jgi:hypothetical protein